MGGCSVASCKNRFVRGSKHFFRFPKDWRRDVWAKFTMRSDGFKPKSSSTICEDHFPSDSFQKKKDRVCMNKDAVPTLILRNNETFEVRFDAEKREYYEEDFKTLKPAPQELEDAILEERQARLDELKNLCRFCVTNDESNVSISNLQTYSINCDELAVLLGIDPQTSDLFSEFLCEQCFQQIVQLDAFKKKVNDAHLEVLGEIQKIDEKLENIRSSRPIKYEQYDSMDADQLVEEHLIDEEFIDGEIEYIEEIATADDMTDIITEEQPTMFEMIEEPATSHGVDEYEMVTTDDIIKNPERNRFCFKIYECFFCKMVRIAKFKVFFF